MKHLLHFFCCFFLLINPIFAQKSAHFGASKYAPEDGKKLLIMGQDLGAVGGLDQYSDGYVNHIKTHLPAGVTSYTNLPSLDGLTNLANWGSGDVHAQSYLENSVFSNSFIVIGLYIVDKLDPIIKNKYDVALVKLADWVKMQNRPVFIRIGYEFDGSWNHYNPGKFKKAWKHIVHVFDKEAVHNVAYVWQSAGIEGTNLNNWYPGDEYVNWVGYSHFDGPNPGKTTIEFGKLHNKPIMIAEAAPRRDLKATPLEAHWNIWYEPLFQTIYANKEIKALAYINVNWNIQPMWIGQGWGDSRIQSNAIVRDKWIAETAKSPWITASDSLFRQLRYEFWQSTAQLLVSESETSGIKISTAHNHLSVVLQNGAMMDGIHVYTSNGKSIFESQSQATSYRTALDTVPDSVLLIAVVANGRRYLLKYGWVRR